MTTVAPTCDPPGGQPGQPHPPRCLRLLVRYHRGFHDVLEEEIQEKFAAELQHGRVRLEHVPHGFGWVMTFVGLRGPVDDADYVSEWTACVDAARELRCAWNVDLFVTSYADEQLMRSPITEGVEPGVLKNELMASLRDGCAAWRGCLCDAVTVWRHCCFRRYGETGADEAKRLLELEAAKPTSVDTPAVGAAEHESAGPAGSAAPALGVKTKAGGNRALKRQVKKERRKQRLEALRGEQMHPPLASAEVSGLPPGVNSERKRARLDAFCRTVLQTPTERSGEGNEAGVGIEKSGGDNAATEHQPQADRLAPCLFRVSVERVAPGSTKSKQVLRGQEIASAIGHGVSMAGSGVLAAPDYAVGVS